MPPMSRRSAVLRVAGFVLAAALGVIGIWLIVTGDDSKAVRIGAISAFWGLLLGTYAMFGARLPSVRTAPEPQVAPAAPVPPPSRELDLRQVGELERAAVAAARYEFQQELQAMLRREVTEGFAREVADLRSEVTALRSELVEKVGGQLRLERIETTRLIGSDLEAVQSELRKLRQTSADVDAGPHPVSLPAAISIAAAAPHPHAAPHQQTAHEPPHRPAQRASEPEIHEAEIVGETMHTETMHTAPPREQRPAQQAPAPPPPPVRLPPEPAEPENDDDPFAGMPRITPFTEFALDPIPPTQPEESPGRRHRAEETGNDVLARILAREQR
ncbi:MAG TPA: hypothetical protein VIG48_13635 [Jatrophihabitans sp.]